MGIENPKVSSECSVTNLKVFGKWQGGIPTVGDLKEIDRNLSDELASQIHKELIRMLGLEGCQIVDFQLVLAQIIIWLHQVKIQLF